jgi:hypothetical protein
MSAAKQMNRPDVAAAINDAVRADFTNLLGVTEKKPLKVSPATIKAAFSKYRPEVLEAVYGKDTFELISAMEKVAKSTITENTIGPITNLVKNNSALESVAEASLARATRLAPLASIMGPIVDLYKGLYASITDAGAKRFLDAARAKKVHELSVRRNIKKSRQYSAYVRAIEGLGIKPLSVEMYNQSVFPISEEQSQ